MRTGLVIVDEHLQIDFDEREMIVDGRPIRLRPTECRLLHLLVQHAGRTLPVEVILSRVWGPQYYDARHYIHLYITYLRSNPSRRTPGIS